MANSVHFSDVQLLNLSFLMTIQADILRDPIAACHKYRLNAALAPKLAALSPDQMQSLIVNLNHEFLFILRDDFAQLLDSPSGLLGTLSTVRASGQLNVQPNMADRRANKKS